MSTGTHNLVEVVWRAQRAGAGLSNAETLVLLYLAHRARWRTNADLAAGEAYPSVRRIATDTGLNARTVRRAVRALEERGLVSVATRAWPSGAQASNVYTVVEEALVQIGELNGAGADPEPVAAEGTVPPAHEARPGDATGPAQAARRRHVYPEEFEVFWREYPRREGGKRAAWLVWKRLKAAGELPDLEVLLQAVRDQKRSDQWRRGYVPHARTWLHQGRWEDEPAAGEPDGEGLDPDLAEAMELARAAFEGGEAAGTES